MLPLQEVQVQSLVGEVPHACGAAKKKKKRYMQCEAFFFKLVIGLAIQQHVNNYWMRVYR